MEGETDSGRSHGERRAEATPDRLLAAVRRGTVSSVNQGFGFRVPGFLKQSLQGRRVRFRFRFGLRFEFRVIMAPEDRAGAKRCSIISGGGGVGLEVTWKSEHSILSTRPY